MSLATSGVVTKPKSRKSVYEKQVMFKATSITGGPSGTSDSTIAPAMYNGIGGPGTLDTTMLIGARFRDRPVAV